VVGRRVRQGEGRWPSLPKTENSVFNITLNGDTNAKDVDLSVRMKAVAGETDQGGGLISGAPGTRKNYYLVRYNPLEDNYRLYKVVDGKRILILNADITHSDGWHTLRVTMTGDQITCYYDGKKVAGGQGDPPSPRQARSACGRRPTRSRSSTT